MWLSGSGSWPQAQPGAPSPGPVSRGPVSEAHTRERPLSSRRSRLTLLGLGLRGACWGGPPGLPMAAPRCASAPAVSPSQSHGVRTPVTSLNLNRHPGGPSLLTSTLGGAASAQFRLQQGDRQALSPGQAVGRDGEERTGSQGPGPLSPDEKARPGGGGAAGRWLGSSRRRGTSAAARSCVAITGRGQGPPAG